MSAIRKSKWQRIWQVLVSLHSEPNEGAFDWAQGLRGAVGISIPAVAGLVVDHLPWGILSAFAALWVLSCDVGGAYRQKAAALAGAGVTVLVAYIFGNWTVQSVANYIIGTFVWVFSAALIGVSGSAAAQAGLVSSTIVVTSVVLVVPNEFWIRLALLLLGICWALLLSLALWPLRPYAPLFQALSISCMKLADLADAFWSSGATDKRAPTNLEFAIAYDSFVVSLEQPREMWGAIRARGAGPTQRGLQLLALIEQLDDVARTLVALREIVNLVGSEKWFNEVRQSYVETIHSLTELTHEIAVAVAVHGKRVDPTRLRSVFEKVSTALAAQPQEYSPALFERKELERTAKHLIEQVSDLAEMVSGLKSGNPHFREPPEARFGPRPKAFDPITEIRNNISFRSTSFRHALRLGVASALASLVASAFHLVRGYWIPMTVVLVLKPSFGGTLQRSVQRITGTVLGAFIAAMLLLFIKDQRLLVAGLAALAFATFSLRNHNYGLFALALTPMIMLMLDLSRPVTVADSFLRILHTIIGSALALLSGYLFFPMWESRRLPLHIADALNAEAAFLRALGNALRGQKERPISEFRRDAAVAVSNAATAGQRLLTEPPHRRGDAEASAAAINYCRRILHALAAISDYLTRGSVQLEDHLLIRLVDALAQALDDLATSLREGTEPERLSSLSELCESLKGTLPALSLRQGETPNLTVDNPGKNETQAWLFYHLENVSKLTLAFREVLARLIQFEPRISANKKSDY